jgi:hypothetical protein
VTESKTTNGVVQAVPFFFEKVNFTLALIPVFSPEEKEKRSLCF